MKRLKAAIFWLIFSFGILALAYLAFVCVSLFYIFNDKDVENGASISKYEPVFDFGGENSIGRENAVEMLYSFESARCWNGDGFTFLKIKCKPEALARISKASENPSSTWYRGDKLDHLQKEAAKFAFSLFRAGGDFQSPQFDENHLFYFAEIYFSFSPLCMHNATVLMYDAQNHILYFGNSDT
ncbi:MAG: hypothetical protein J6P03_00285 [Opitutales bacterium]|nr:hypothetical protein [Opitutales bacterium]